MGGSVTLRAEVYRARVEEIRRRWELVTDTGVVVRPTEALVRAMGQKGYDIRAAEALLPEGQRLYEAGE